MSANEIAAYYSPFVVIPLAIWLLAVYYAANHPTVRHQVGARAGVLPVAAVGAADEGSATELRAAQQAAARQWTAEHEPADQARVEEAMALQAVAQQHMPTGDVSEPASATAEAPAEVTPAEAGLATERTVPAPRAGTAAAEPAPSPAGPGPAAPAAGGRPQVPAPRSAGAELPVQDQAGRYVDTQTLSDGETHVFEAIATLEYTGQRATRDQIAAAAGLDDTTMDQILASLVRRGLLARTDSGSTRVYAPAQRNWSVSPQQARGL